MIEIQIEGYGGQKFKRPLRAVRQKLPSKWEDPEIRKYFLDILLTKYSPMHNLSKPNKNASKVSKN